jgi:hyperosmotically inducible protein
MPGAAAPDARIARAPREVSTNFAARRAHARALGVGSLACFLLRTTSHRGGTAMMKTLVLAATLLAWMGLGCSTSRPIDTQASDAMITSQVKSKLAADPQTSALEIDVDTLNGTVTLRGAVDSDEERRDAERLARNTSGVRDVENELEIGSVSAGEEVSDTWIVTKVKSQLAADPEVNSFNIDVDALKGEVTLSGVVTDQRARTEAERIARATEGVTGVRNEIRVR